MEEHGQSQVYVSFSVQQQHFVEESKGMRNHEEFHGIGNNNGTPY